MPNRYSLILLINLATGVLHSSHAQTVLDIATLSPADGGFHRVHGYTGNGAFGVPIAGGVDCDGDGLADYAMASMRASPASRLRAGEVYLVFGNGLIQGALDTAEPQPNILTIMGDQRQEAAGSEIWMDDVTGDGIGDFLIARQNYSPTENLLGAGALSILVGGAELREFAATLMPLDLREPPATVTLTTFTGQQTAGRLGMWMRTGDVTGDGVADIVIGADQEGATAHNGAAYVIRGGAHLAANQTISLIQPETGPLAGHVVRITPDDDAAELHFGATVQIADLDGNGVSEVLITAALNRAGGRQNAAGLPISSAHSGGGPAHGRLYIAWDDNFTAESWADDFSFSMASPPGSRSIITGTEQNVSFGEEVLGGMDYDNDGAADLFVGDLAGNGSPDSSRNFSGIGHVIYDSAMLKGLVFAMDSAPPEIEFSTFIGANNGDIAADTAAQGDFDGDGIADLAFSAPHGTPLDRVSAGILYVLHGQTGRWPEFVDLHPQTERPPNIQITDVFGALGDDAIDAGDTLMYSGAAGDINGDGLQDIIVNEMLGNGVLPDATDTGNLIVISGALFSALSNKPIPFDFNNGVLRLPIVGFGSSVGVNATLQLTDPVNGLFALNSIESILLPGATSATFTPDTGRLDIPAVQVGDVVYSVGLDLQQPLTEPLQFLLSQVELANATTR